jgi:hypothetical protein
LLLAVVVVEASKGWLRKAVVLGIPAVLVVLRLSLQVIGSLIVAV